MRQGFSTPALLISGTAILLVVLLNLYLVQPRLALLLEAPQPLPSIAQMSSPPPGKQVAETMNLIKKMGAEKQRAKELFIPRQNLRNPFLDPELKEMVLAEEESGIDGDELFLAQVQMVMIGEYLKSALLDGTLVAEGDTYKGFRVERITGEGVYLQRFEETVMLPLGAYATAELSLHGKEREVRPEKQPPAPMKQKAALNELLRRLEPLLDQDAGGAKGKKSKK
ncbi:MAG: hypothetical protein U9N63_11200 [Pseudomonadota bacterium]|nr:hypothetical protein [Pseudomonadota bacterium]